VWLTLGSWDPTSQGLRDWVTAVMARDYPYLKAADFGGNAIGQMFDSGQIALFLDGLDEMPEAFLARAAERLITETGGLRLVLSSRPDHTGLPSIRVGSCRIPRWCNLIPSV
jgi:hypothetical protein